MDGTSDEEFIRRLQSLRSQVAERRKFLAEGETLVQFLQQLLSSLERRAEDNGESAKEGA